MLEEYKKRVLLSYQKKKESHQLSGNLVTPSPGKLRDECLIVYGERFQQKDDEILRLFFKKDSEGDYTKSIYNFNIDELRPLEKILKTGKIGRSYDRNISLLAWLINFEPRPYRFVPPDTSGNYNNEEGTSNVGNPVVIHQPDVNPQHKTTTVLTVFDAEDTRVDKVNWWNKSKNWKIWTVTICCLLISFIVLAYYQNRNYMYWDGDHYEKVSRFHKVDAAIIPFQEKMAELKRITRLDTVTRNAIGHVWYAKPKRDSVDFFTDSGEYPMDRRKRLLPVTDYILKKYIFDKRTK